MDFWLTDDQADLQAGIRSFLDGRYDLEVTAAREETDAVIDPAGWSDLAEMGVFSLVRDGLDLRAAAIAFEELGRSLVPGPLAATFVAASCDALASAADGARIVGLFEPQGELAMVEHPMQVTDLVWFADGEVRHVDPATLSLTPVTRDLDPLSPVASTTDLAPAFDVIATGDDARRMHSDATLLTAAVAVGVSAAATDLATAYAKEREQFGRPIGSFQAVKHLLAEMFTKTDVARAAVHAAACALDGASNEDPTHTVSVAKVMAGDAALFCGKTGIQVHGGMGFTWEVHAQRYWKRAVVLDATLGSSDHHAELVAASLLSS